MAARKPGSAFRSSLPLRTFLGFAAATLAIVAMSVVSYESLDSRASSVDRIQRTLEVTQHIELVASSLKDAETGQRGFLLTGDERYLGPYDDATASLPRALAATRLALRGDAAQLARLDTLEELVHQRLDELRRTIVLGREGRADEALAVVRSDFGRELMDRARQVVEEMKESERIDLQIRTAEWRDAAAFSTTVVWAGSALLLVLVGSAGVLSSRDFRAQKVETWLRAGQTELAQRAQGVHSVERLGESVALALARHLQAPMAALYYAERADELRLVGGYSLPHDAGRDRATGLTLQAFRENAIFEVKEVPDDYFPIASGLGQRRPRHLLIGATTADGVPNGVIELGFFQQIAPEDLALLRRLTEPMGTALRTAKYRSELERLLSETQSQAEELQAQQEELRVSNEELEQQSRALQASQARLENQQAELEQLNASLEEHNQAVMRERDNLERAQVELERANAYKSEFLANMSHELRTPLNSSLILAKLLADNRDGNLTAEQVKFATTIYSAGNDLLTLINDILDLSKIEAGKLDVRPAGVSIARLLDDLAATFEPVAQEKKLELATRVEGDVPDGIHTDHTRLQQILKNLLSNALKFTEQGGVSLNVRRARDGRIAFEVKDTGIGIPPEQHEMVFEPFRQGEGGATRRHGGTGLGLSISRDLSRLLGGELTLESAPGRGSTFTLQLPEEFVPREEAPSPRRASSPLPPRPDSKRPRQKPLAAAPADDRETVSTGARTILVIEDDVAFANVIRDLAHELDFQVLLAESAEDGLAMTHRYRPSAIVLDVGLPDRSGLSVLDTLKHSPTTRHIPVHVISASDYTQAALEMGALGYDVKPVPREELVEALRRLEAKFTQKLRRVLVVEDDERQRETTCLLLASDDVETIAVGTAAEALAQLSATTFDCMVLDLSLPDRTGFDLLDEMSREEQYSFPPVIVYTGRSLSRDEEQRLRRFSSSIIIKGARSPERLLDEVTLFLHQVESELPPDRQRMLRDARHREAAFEGRRVLVVEDDVRNIFALSSVLEPRGATVEIARNGREAIEILEQKPSIDLVLMDIMMPEMDGLEAIREIRKRPLLQKTPIIALTAKAMADDREACLAAGANDYIAKPLDIDKLLSLSRVWMPK
jgi:CheY-like chemotaxis protein/CHASE3 domain sensor protein